MTGPTVTIVDIAQALGISKTAVSSALHGRGRVSEATRERVLAQAEAMGYVSNRAAQRLRGGSHGAIGLHIPADVRELSFYMEFAFGAADVAAETGNDLLLLADTAAQRAGRRPSIDGLLALDPAPSSFGEAIARVGPVPIVSVGDYEGPERERVSAWIAADHAGLVREVLDTLGSAGSAAPALVALESEREPLWATHVVDGYRSWCAARGIESVLRRLPVTPEDDAIRSVLEDLAATGADSIVWVGQGLAMRARALWGETRSARTPRPILATMAAEPGSVGVLGIDLRARDYGRAAARLLLRVISGEAEQGERVVHHARLLR